MDTCELETIQTSSKFIQSSLTIIKNVCGWIKVDFEEYRRRNLKDTRAANDEVMTPIKDHELNLGYFKERLLSVADELEEKAKELRKLAS